MILVASPEGVYWRTLSALWKYWGDRSQTEQGDKAREEAVEDRKTTEPSAVRVRDKRLSFITEDTNDPKCLGFHSVKPRKV